MAGDMAIGLYRGDIFVSSLDGAEAEELMLGYFGVQEYDVLKVDGNRSNFTRVVDFDDLDKVEKYEMPTEQYEQRQDTVAAFKKRNKIGRFGEQQAATPHQDSETIEELKARMSLNSRCEVKMTNEGLARRGTVRFVGKTEFASGLWVGVEYDEPLGKNDGSISGIRYFSCADKYGAFVRPNTVECGDFPEELDISDLEEL
ncbi:Tubulin-folding cofactor B [Smittium culicis]|uniref:Tubulin-folding cofactor B n=1 Tax=Smittium culicis TaxID=133412 RepID=A0A1R1XRS1_9FUNG|nr:Tubulin-folding cofactor B [Smittium culicis]